MNRRILTILLAMLLIGLGWSLSVHAGAKEIKQRMKERLPAINALKAKGIIGENNLGFLTYRGNERPQASLIEAENADRRRVYAAIARQQKVDITKVGQRRAVKIAQTAKSGNWLQTPDGKWQRK